MGHPCAVQSCPSPPVKQYNHLLRLRARKWTTHIARWWTTHITRLWTTHITRRWHIRCLPTVDHAYHPMVDHAYLPTWRWSNPGVSSRAYGLPVSSACRHRTASVSLLFPLSPARPCTASITPWSRYELTHNLPSVELPSPFPCQRRITMYYANGAHPRSSHLKPTCT